MDILDKEEILIDNFKNTDMVKKIIELKNNINKNNIKLDKENDLVKEYIKNINELDLYIFYLNSEIKKIINNKTCRSNNESN